MKNCKTLSIVVGSVFFFVFLLFNFIRFNHSAWCNIIRSLGNPVCIKLYRQRRDNSFPFLFIFSFFFGVDYPILEWSFYNCCTLCFKFNLSIKRKKNFLSSNIWLHDESKILIRARTYGKVENERREKYNKKTTWTWNWYYAEHFIVSFFSLSLSFSIFILLRSILFVLSFRLAVYAHPKPHLCFIYIIYRFVSILLLCLFFQFSEIEEHLVGVENPFEFKKKKKEIQNETIFIKLFAEL